ncbi:MAG TPA: selenoneine biosynthesis selenosugar synthase SenB [Vicinamibacteria bacterium]|nr:selenoneine biosynthesis selenosugar synthase SenB [Vicinamibacteria bacterium]
MKITLATPSSPRPGVVTGNEVTATRWASILTDLGHSVVDSPDEADLLVALHASRSAPAVRAFHDRPVIVALTGTDLYQDLPGDEDARESLRRASRVVVLQPGALDVLDATTRMKTVVIYQSARPLRGVAKVEDAFQVCLIAHLREVKDPFVGAEATRRLPATSRLRLVHAGAAFSEPMRLRASELVTLNPRYLWLGGLGHQETRSLIARSHLMLLTSRFEGGANALSEALAADVPIVAPRAPGVEGLLGASYPGLFASGQIDELVRLLVSAEQDAGFRTALENACRSLAPLVDPALEKSAWAQLLAGLSGSTTLG